MRDARDSAATQRATLRVLLRHRPAITAMQPVLLAQPQPQPLPLADKGQLMYEYLAVPDVRPAELTEVCRAQQSEGWSVEQIDSYPDRHGHENRIRYAVVFKKFLTGVENQSLETQQTIRVSKKLQEVRDALVPVMDVMDDDGRKGALGRVVADIDKFMFDGSPSDM